MRNLVLVTAIAMTLMPMSASASWLSKISGVSVDLNRGRVEISQPDVGAIPEMIQNLPKDVGQAMLNPFAPALATAIRFSRGQAINRGVRPIPTDVRSKLLPYFPPDLLDKVRWTMADGVSIDGALKNWLNQEGAVTLDEVIVFSDERLTNDIELWAHEITHVLQYSQMGVETFAFTYSVRWDELESQASQNAAGVDASIANETDNGSASWGYEGEVALSSEQPAWATVNQAAYNTIDPAQCIWIDGASNTTGNKCPIRIRVSGVVIRRQDGYTFTFPCNEPTCIFQPGQAGPLLSPPGHLIVGVTAAYEL